MAVIHLTVWEISSLLRCPLARNGSPDTMEQQMLKSPNSSQTSDRDRDLTPLTDNEVELVSGGAINPNLA